MAENFYSLLTNIGKAKLANAQVLGTKVEFSSLAVGDGGGDYYEPAESQTALKNEVWRGQINRVKTDDDNDNWIVIEVVIPTATGGFTIREAGVIDSEGDLIAVGKYPATYKPVLSEGSGKELYIRMILEVSNVSSVTLKIDPAVVLSTRGYVDDSIAEHNTDPSAHGNLPYIKLSQAANFAPSGYGIGKNTSRSAADLNAAVQGGLYSWTSGASNAPANTGALLVIPRPDNHVQQLAVSAYGGEMFKRYYDGSAWSSWVEIWDASHDGPGSGLDADKVDGKEAAYFAAASHVHSAATSSVNGFMSKTDKAKLDRIAAGAQVNQNSFASVKVGDATIAADTVSDTLTLTAGANIRLTPDTATDSVTVALSGTIPTAANADKLDGKDAADFAAASHSHSAATTSSNGFMSNTDKAKLDGIAAGAQVNQNAFSNVKVGSSTIAADSVSDTLTLAAGTNIKLTPSTSGDSVTVAVSGTVASAANAVNATNATNATSAENAVNADKLDGKDSSAFSLSSHTHTLATGSSNGFMSAGDKTKLDSGVVLHSLCTAKNDFLIGASGGGSFEKKTLAEVKTLIGSQIKYIKITDTKPSGTKGGTFSSGAWRTRDLNTIDTDDTGAVTLSSNRFTLPSGSYVIRASAPGRKVKGHQAKLYDVTNAENKLIGTSEFSDSAVVLQTRSFICGAFTLNGSTALEIQHRCSQSYSDTGLGSNCGYGVNEIYTVVELWKVA